MCLILFLACDIILHCKCKGINEKKEEPFVMAKTQIVYRDIDIARRPYGAGTSL